MTKWKALALFAVLALAGCGKPQSVTDLKAAIAALQDADGKPGISQDRYHALVTGARARFDAAKPGLSSSAVTAVGEALDRAGDVDLVWRDTYDIADGLTPVVQAPLTRLGVTRTDKEFQDWVAGFIPLQESPDDETAGEASEKEKVRDASRQDLIHQSMDGAAPALQKAQTAL